MSSSASTALAGRPDHGAAGELLSELFEEHGKSVYGLCRFLLRDPVEAEDAAQQAFLSAHQALLSGAGPREPGPWLAAIARNECRARIHDRMRSPLPLQEEFDAPVAGPHDTVATRLETAELFRAMHELPEAQREAVLLRDVCGLSYDEAAGVLSVSRANVETLIFRGRSRLAGRVEHLRASAAGLAVPVALREALAQSVPGFAASSGGAAAASGVAAGLAAKVFAVPAVKAAAAGLAALTVTGATLAERGHLDRSAAGAAPVRASAGLEGPLLTGDSSIPPVGGEPSPGTLWDAREAEEERRERAEERRERAEERREREQERREERREAREEAAEEAADRREDAADDAADWQEDAADDAADAAEEAADAAEDAADDAADAAEDAAEEAAEREEERERD